MSDADRLLTELWAQDEPPERDSVFVLAAMERIERRRLWLEALNMVPLIAAACAALAVLGPGLARAIEAAMPTADSAAVAPVAGGLVIAVFLWTWVTGRLGPQPA